MQFFRAMVEKHRAADDFPCAATDATGRPAIPLELKILAALRVLGRALTFDDVAEFTNASANTMRTFFYKV